MTKAGSNISDSRLLSILRGGEVLRYMVDPEGVLSEWKVSSMDISSSGVGLDWSAVFVNDKMPLTVSGRIAEHQVGIVHLKSNLLEITPEKAVSSVLEALGNLSGLPARLKGLLSPVVPEMFQFEHSAFWVDNIFLNNESEALFWAVDGGRQEDGYRKYFTVFRTKFSVDREGRGKVELSSAYEFSNSRIVLRTDVDVFGLGNKKVFLEKNLGLGRFAKCECIRQMDGKTVPSLVVAFDMAAAVPLLYCKERKVRNGVPVPGKRV